LGLKYNAVPNDTISRQHGAPHNDHCHHAAVCSYRTKALEKSLGLVSSIVSKKIASLSSTELVMQGDAVPIGDSSMEIPVQ